MTSVGNEPLVKIKEYPTLVKPWSINPSLLTQLSLRDENRKADISLHHVIPLEAGSLKNPLVKT